MEKDWLISEQGRVNDLISFTPSRDPSGLFPRPMPPIIDTKNMRRAISVPPSRDVDAQPGNRKKLSLWRRLFAKGGDPLHLSQNQIQSL